VRTRSDVSRPPACPVGLPTPPSFRGVLTPSPNAAKPRLAFRSYASLLLTCSLMACATGPSQEETVERSMREYQLAVGLRGEGNTPAAREHVRVALELDPENAEAILFLGYLDIERQEFLVAEQHLREGIRLLVEQERLASALAEARNLLGLVLLEQGRTDEAIEILRLSATDAMNVSPHLAWGNIGLALLRKQDYPGALAALEQAVAIQPRFCVGFARIGEVLVAQENYEGAEQALSRALEADPTCATHAGLQNAWRLRGEARAHLGHREDAITDFERCVELAPSTQEGARCQAFLDGTP
jgi:type IV pilus assembly protein PilF